MGVLWVRIVISSIKLGLSQNAKKKHDDKPTDFGYTVCSKSWIQFSLGRNFESRPNDGNCGAIPDWGRMTLDRTLEMGSKAENTDIMVLMNGGVLMEREFQPFYPNFMAFSNTFVIDYLFLWFYHWDPMLGFNVPKPRFQTEKPKSEPSLMTSYPERSPTTSHPTPFST